MVRNPETPSFRALSLQHPAKLQHKDMSNGPFSPSEKVKARYLIPTKAQRPEQKLKTPRPPSPRGEGSGAMSLFLPWDEVMRDFAP